MTDTMMCSDSLVNIIGFVLVAATLWIIAIYLKGPKNLPPGPTGIPILGYMPFLGSKPYLTLVNLKEKYGDLFTLYLGPDRVVVLSSFKLIKEAFLKQGNFFEERPESMREIFHCDSQTGLVSAVGAHRVELRRFTISILRNLGFGKVSLEPNIQDEIDCVIKEIKKLKGKPTDLHRLIQQGVTNIIFVIMFGKRIKYTSKTPQHLIELSDALMAAVGINQWARFLPNFLIKLFGILQPVELGYRLYKELLDEAAECYKTQNNLSDDKSFTTAWRTEAAKSNSTYTLEKLSQVLVELFTGGSDTTSSTLGWGLLYLIKYPAVQTKLQQEIDNVIGKDRTPSMSDQRHMPYAEATIMEINRITSIAPLLSHYTIKDTTLDGYFIPKNTTVLANLWDVHMDPKIFPESDCFKPERFLTENNTIKRVGELIPFSIGKRQCPGESLARMQLFLFLTSLLQHFTFTKDDDVILDCDYSFVLQPKKQKISAILR